MAKPTSRKAAPARLSPPDTAAAAYERIAAELDALPAEQVGVVGVDVSTAAATVLGAAAKLEPLLPEMKAKLPAHPVKAIAKLPDYALGALYAHLQSFGPKEVEPNRLKDLLAEAAPLRQRLLAVAEMLSSLELVDASRIGEIRAGSGHLDAANDLIALSALFGNDWPTLANKVPVTEAEIERAATLGTELLVALGARKVPAGGEPGAKGWADRKARALRLMVDAYDSARQAVTYLRWREGDAEAFTPSLFARRRRTVRADDGDDETPVEPQPAGGETD